MGYLELLGPAIIAGIVAWITSIITARSYREKLRREFQLEFATEAALKELLNSEDYKMRSFAKIRHHLRGFSDDDLRRHLIRAGAVCFTSTSQEEMWGLLEKHKGETFK